jgi:hypothetical protein
VAGARSCSFVRPDDHFTIAGDQWPNHPAGLSGAAKHSDCSNWKLVPCTTVAIAFKLEGNVIGERNQDKWEGNMEFGYFTLSDNHYANNSRKPNQFVLCCGKDKAHPPRSCGNGIAIASPDPRR